MYEQYLIVYALAAFIADDKNKILLVKKSPAEQIDAGLWVVPGGKVHRDENVIVALKREVKEEIGLSVISYRWIGEDVFKVSDQAFHAAHFLCKADLKDKIILEDKLEDYKWVTREEVFHYKIPVNLKKEIVNIFENYFNK